LKKYGHPDRPAEAGLYALIYLSRARTFPASEDRPTFEHILAQAKARNAQSGVTGALISHAGMFLQVLEGDRAAVISTYQRILHDPRHHTCHLVWHGPITSRQFLIWGTCGRFVEAAGTSGGPLSAFLELLQPGQTISAHRENLLPTSQTRQAAQPRVAWEEDGDVIYL
jgi:hypothetical protein